MTRIDEVIRVGGNGSLVIEPDEVDETKPLVIQRPVKLQSGEDLQTTLDAKAGDADIPTRASLGLAPTDTPIFNTSAVMVEGKLATITGLDLSTTDPAVLFAAPAGKSCIVTKVILRNPSVDLTGSGRILTFEIQLTTWATLALSASKLIGSNFYGIILPGTADYIFDAGITPRRIAPSSALRVSLDGTFGSAETVIIDIFGYLY